MTKTSYNYMRAHVMTKTSNVTCVPTVVGVTSAGGAVARQLYYRWRSELSN